MPAWLGWEELLSLQEEYPHSPYYGYDPSAFERRGQERAEQVLSVLHRDADRAETFLELGCADAMVSCVLQRMGKTATAIDAQPGAFDKRAEQAGVKWFRMDAETLEFPDESFDCVFSYNAFEHFAGPERVMQEALRVLKRRGHVYLSFGPLFMSPMGQHAFHSVTVPYCQFFFTQELLERYTRENGLRAIDFSSLNEWPVARYRKLWRSLSDRFARVFYHENTCYSHLDLVARYPSCFRSKTKDFDDLVVSGITVLLRKR